MILTDYFRYPHDLTWDYAVQCGVRHGVIRAPETEDFALCSAESWSSLGDAFRQHGISPLVLEPIPNKLHDHIKAGDAQRDEAIEQFIKMLPLIRRQGIETVCFNFMAHVGWTRTRRDYPERGGARVTGFDLADYVPSEASITEDDLWRNYEYFIRAVLPEAERQDVKLALHPDDPPILRLGSVSRIMTSYENIDRAVNMAQSPYLGVTFCQATYHMMRENIIEAAEKFGKKIFFIHFRNCRGRPERFVETFHDNGEINMARMIETYCRLGLNVPIRVDHVPEMAGEEEGTAGYTALGRLYAIGYLKGLLEMYDERLDSGTL